MVIRYDEKGKFFTDLVSKDQVEVIIQTSLCRIIGQIYVRAGLRLKDEINNADKFIAITAARIFDHQGVEILATQFLSVNRDQIIWVLPAKEVMASPVEEGGGG
jgi:hypothetical protein